MASVNDLSHVLPANSAEVWARGPIVGPNERRGERLSPAVTAHKRSITWSPERNLPSGGAVSTPRGAPPGDSSAHSQPCMRLGVDLQSLSSPDSPLDSPEESPIHPSNSLDHASVTLSHNGTSDGSLPPSSSVGSGSYDNPSMWVTYPSLGSEYKLSASYFVHR
ncbi:hypothetical protein C0Q70_17163 [Pomacea canaliculata]|uniref:Uncharacterized protein n=1 Tax=Pomacea canaliculata TaxID=400727 RepID=A0A2T7NRV5_POMCA|nr:hypothetical protein C0Q70_17163 [Pomacea canaliculata]